MKLSHLAVPSLLVSAAFSAFAACSSDDSPAAPPDSGLDAKLLGEAAPPPADVEAPLGDTCGNAGGLAPNAPWPMRGGCPKRAGFYKSTGPDDAVVNWTMPLTGTASTPVVDASGLIWVGEGTGVTVLRRSGDVQSHFDVASPVDSSAAVDANGHVLFATHEGTLYGLGQAFPMVDGGPDAAVDDAGTPIARVIISKMIGDSGQSPAIGADGTIYIGTHDGKMNALAADLTTVKWSVSVGGDASATLSADGTIYAGSTDKKVYALDAATGAVKWTVETGDAIVAPVAVGGDETIYAASSDGTLYAIDGAGKTKWSAPIGGALKSTPAVSGGTVYVGSDDKKLHALRTDTGHEKWAYATLGAASSPVVAKDGIVYVGSGDGHLYAVTPGGSLYFAVNLKGSVSGPPAFGSDGAIYVATTNALVSISR